MALTPAQRARRQAQQSGAQANRTRNSQLLAAYAANPSTIPNPNGPASTPAYVPPQAPPAQPLDPQFEAYKASSQRNLQVSQLGGLYNQAQIGNEFGFGSDKSNPYSQAKLLEESYKRSKLGTTNSYASSGQLHSGAYSRMQGENDRNYSIGVDRGTRDMNDALAQNMLGQMQAGAEYGIGTADADFQALLNAFKSKFGG